MKTLALFTLVLFATCAEGQSPCDNVKLYDQMVVKGDQPMFHKLKRFNVKLIPDSTLLQMKQEITALTSPEFFSGLKIKSAKLFDSAVATAWSWTHEPMVDRTSRPVFFFYAVVFETTTASNTPFVFRVDVLKSGELLNRKQLAFYKSARLKLIDCKKIAALVLADTIQPVTSIEYMALAYSIKDQTILWTIASVADSKSGLQYFKDVNAVTGKIMRRSVSDLNQVPMVEKLEEVQIKND